MSSAERLRSVVGGNTRCRVSSVLNRDAKQFGKQHMFDGSDETCWNSHQGSPQWVALSFEEAAVDISEVRLMFQGGFVAKEVQIQAKKQGATQLESVATFYPEDVNNMQCFPCSLNEVQELRLNFPQSTDFYGRITIYRLEILGQLDSKE